MSFSSTARGLPQGREWASGSANYNQSSILRDVLVRMPLDEQRLDARDHISSTLAAILPLATDVQLLQMVKLLDENLRVMDSHPRKIKL